MATYKIVSEVIEQKKKMEKALLHTLVHGKINIDTYQSKLVNWCLKEQYNFATDAPFKDSFEIYADENV